MFRGFTYNSREIDRKRKSKFDASKQKTAMFVRAGLQHPITNLMRFRPWLDDANSQSDWLALGQRRSLRVQ